MRYLTVLTGCLVVLTLVSCNDEDVLTGTPTSEDHSLTNTDQVDETDTPASMPTSTSTQAHLAPEEGVIYYAIFETREIFTLDPSSNITNRLFQLVPEADSLPSFSPDSSQVVFSRDTSTTEQVSGQINIMNIDGSNIRTIFSATNIVFGPTWSTDGRRIIFFYGGPTPDAPVGLFSIDTDGANLQRITEGNDRCPVWLSSKEQIVFRRGISTFGIYSMDMTDNHLEQVSPETKFAVSCPVVSSNEQQLLFIDDSQRQTLNKLNLDNLHLTQISVDWSIRSLVWSPDNKQIAFVGDDNGHYALYIMEEDGDKTSLIQEFESPLTLLQWKR